MLNLESLVLDSDHPRSRGVYGTGHDCLSRPQGSSPLARGLRQVPRPTGAWTRIIPARAGFTRSTGSDASPSQDHPRSRGVYNAAASPDTMSAGSSPLARGLQRRRVTGHDVRGIIPARAGFTAAGCCGSTPSWDHPRSRGVYQSSWSRVISRVRIIPARAGFTTTSGPRRRPASDHPRSRGVYAARPPRSPVSEWIIPARAGFTQAVPNSLNLYMDHPRSRGVYSPSSS